MKVGILGSGEVGRALGTAFARHGHAVTIGSGTPDKPELLEWKRATGPGAATASFADAARTGDLVALCCLGSAAETVLDLAGPAHLDGKVLIDVTNPLDLSHGMPPGLLVGMTDSLGERVQRKVPGARVVKCFNTVPSTIFGDPSIGGAVPDMLIAGNDPSAKAQVVEILTSFGWTSAIDLGGIESSRWLEALVMAWVRTGLSLGNFRIAFKVLR
jgi:8-hydroxy-5-deazaflavin:NADPH oxidoreductase